MEILQNIPVTLEPEEMIRKLRLKRTDNSEQVLPLLEEANSLIEPKAVYRVSYIDEKLEDGVIIDGIHLTSRVLRKNLDEAGRVFPFVITIGKRLEDKARDSDDLLKQYYLDVIGNVALIKARKYMEEQVRSKFALEGISQMSPGSLEDWPIEEQRPLFTILGDVAGAIDVNLSESLLMIPKKSSSGIFFPTEVTFYSCQLCPREHCEGRKAAYSRKLAEEYGVVK